MLASSPSHTDRHKVCWLACVVHAGTLCWLCGTPPAGSGAHWASAGGRWGSGGPMCCCLLVIQYLGFSSRLDAAPLLYSFKTSSVAMPTASCRRQHASCVICAHQAVVFGCAVSRAGGPGWQAAGVRLTPRPHDRVQGGVREVGPRAAKGGRTWRPACALSCKALFQIQQID